MTALHLDIESYSEANLKDVGVYKYAEDPSTELLCAAYSFGDGPTYLWVPVESLPAEVFVFAGERGIPRERFVVQPEVPEAIVEHVANGREVRAHNAQFERVVLNGTAGKRVGFPRMEIEQMVCTAAKARNHGLPGALGDAAEALNTRRKNPFGHGVMLQLCRPRTGKDKRYAIAPEWEKYAQLYVYNYDDVEAEKALDEAVPDLTPAEQAVWRMDQHINDRGIRVDLAAIADVEFLIDEYKTMLEKLCMSWTGFKPSQREKLSAWVRAQGYPQLVDMTADSVKWAVADASCPEHVKQVLKLYSTYGMKAVSKYGKMVEAACADARLRGMFMYYGAGTGRWSSMIVQLQNLFRPVIEDADVAISLFKDRDLEWVRTLYQVDPMKVFSSCVRGMLIPADGHDIMAIDLAGIESRLTAWVFNEIWKLIAFRKRDNGTGPDTYKLAYAKAFKILVDEVTKFQRQIGKVMELALGFEGGVGAFITMAPNYGVDLDELAEIAYPNIPVDVLNRAYETWEWSCEQKRTYDLDQKVFVVIQSLVSMWRADHPAHVEGWKEMKEAAIAAVENRGTAYKIKSGLITFKVIPYKGNDWLYMRLPSGRRIAYFKPVVDYAVPRPPKGFVEEEGYWVKKDKKTGEVEDRRPIPPPRKALSYMGVDTNTRRWMRVTTYGGRLTQNFAEGIARDLLVNGMQKLEAAGYKAIGSVHDEAISEPPEGHGSLEAARELFLDAPAWAAGLPLNAEGFRVKRYRK